MQIHIFIAIIFCFAVQILKAQTVIEMMHPEDANSTLLIVDNIDDADIVVYKTNKKDEYQQWDCMWKFKKGGFSNFSVYLTRDENDSLLSDNDEGVKRMFHGKIYFTENIEDKGYKNKEFRLEGVFRKLPN